MATVADALRCSAELADISNTPRLDVEVLLAHAIGKDRTYLFTWPEHDLSSDQINHFESLLERRKSGEPVAYITGVREFWSLPLAVSKATLIPRPETEILVQAALDLCLPATARVLDLGTGTGAIALALATERPQWSVVAVDNVPEAVALAQGNCEKLALSNVVIKQSDWFSALERTEPFDLIVSNPPYIDVQDPHLVQGDVRFEPRSALVAEQKGLAEIEHIAKTVGDFLNSGAWLMFEHGFEQGNAVRNLLGKYGFSEVITQTDFAGRDRVTFGKTQGQP